MTNEERRAIVNRATSLGYQGDYVELFRAYAQGQDPLGELELQMQRQANMPMQVANTPQEQSQGLIPFHQAGQTGQSMAFPDVQPHQPFTTKGLTAPIDMTKVDHQGNVVESYKAVQPGIANIPTGPYEGTMIETPAKSYMRGGFIKKYQVAGVKQEEEETPINENIGRYGRNSSMIQTAQEKKESTTSLVPPELITQLEEVQNEINQGSSKRAEYEKKVAESINALGNINVARTNYMPEEVKEAARAEGKGPFYCISGVCYTLNDAGEDIRYYSNSELQDDVLSGKRKGWAINNDTKTIQGGDIVQFLKHSRKNKSGAGGPHHAALVVPNSIKYNEDGTISFDAYMNDGGGEMRLREGYILDPKTDVVTNSSNKEKIQLITKTFDNAELVTKRDQLKEQIKSYDPSYFEPGEKTIRYNTYAPDQIEQTALGTSMGERPLNYLGRKGGGDLLDKVAKKIGKNMSYQEFADKIQLQPILDKVNDPEFKKDFMERYNISNEEYNAVVKTAVGVYGQETAFGFKPGMTENDLDRKILSRTENFFRVISGKERRSTDMRDFSRGLTQIKLRNISEEDQQKYGITSEALDEDPVTAIVGAMIVNAQNLPTLRKVASDGRNEEVTQANYLDYLPYLYNQRGVILRGDEKNEQRASKKARYGRKGEKAEKASEKAAEESTIKNPYSIKANNKYVSNVTAFGNLVEVMPSNVPPVEITANKLGGAKKCYTCGGMKVKVRYNKLGYKK